jgi:hypothetical protein
MIDYENKQDAEAEAARRALGQMIGGYHVSQLVHVAARLGLADRMKDGPQRSEELAPEVGANARALHRLMRALVEIGLMTEGEDGRFDLTPVGRWLQEDAPNSLRAAALCYGDAFYRAWALLLHSVRTGETAFEKVLGMPFFDYYCANPEAGEAFNGTMATLSRVIAGAVVAAYDFSGIRTIVDIGGGHGALLAAVLKANPPMKGILFDLPVVIESARPSIEAEGLADRCELVAGDFFEAVPAGGDAYLMKWIIHDWDDERAVRILESCRRAMGNSSRLLLVEAVMPERLASGPINARSDINMMVLTGGCERTEPEYRALLAAAGFRLTRVIPTDLSGCSPITGGWASVVEAVPVQ